jgi:hypothetical protein
MRISGNSASVNTGRRADRVPFRVNQMDLHRHHWPEFEGECEVRRLEDNQ